MKASQYYGILAHMFLIGMFFSTKGNFIFFWMTGLFLINGSLGLAILYFEEKKENKRDDYKRKI